MRNRTWMVGPAAAGVLAMVGCARPHETGTTPHATTPPAGDTAVNTPPQPSPDVQGTFIGTLRGGMMGIGGEHTGWVLQGPEDGRGGGMMVDVSGVRDAVEQLDGKPVSIRGRVETRRYVERGAVQVLIAESINRRQE